MLDDILQMIWVDDDVQTAELSSSEFLGSNTGEADSFPYLWDVGLLGGIVGLNVLLVHDKYLSKLLVISKFGEDDLSSLVHLGIEALVSDLLKISLIWLSHEVFHIDKALLTASSIGIDEFRINNLFFE